MKRSISLVLAILMVASLMVFGSVTASAETVTLIAAGSDGWKAQSVAGNEGETFDVLPEGWTIGEGIDEWGTYATPMGNVYMGNTWPLFDNGQGGPVQPAFAAVKEFEVTDPDSIVELKMWINYDEDPVVYLNGTEVFTATRWSAVTVDLTEHLDLLKEGTNVIAVAVKQGFGGCGLDLSLEATVGDIELIDENGYVIFKDATGKGACGEDANGNGGIGAYDHILDGNNNNMYGNFFVDGMYVEISFYGEVAVTEIEFEGKNEGEPNADGISGLVDVYVGETLVADDAYVIRKDLGGYTITLDTPVVGSSVKFAFESADKWYAGGFTGIADAYVKGVAVEDAAASGIIEYEGTQGSTTENAVRFIASTGSLDFDSVGMMISTTDKDGSPKSWTVDTDKVYAALNATNGVVTADEGESLYGVELYNIPEGTYTFTIVTYGKTANGIVLGKPATVTATVSANGSTIG